MRHSRPAKWTRRTPVDFDIMLCFIDGILSFWAFKYASPAAIIVQQSQRQRVQASDQISFAVRTVRSSLFLTSASVTRLPSECDANPHCGLIQSLEMRSEIFASNDTIYDSLIQSFFHSPFLLAISDDFRGLVYALLEFLRILKLVARVCQKCNLAQPKAFPCT